LPSSASSGRAPLEYRGPAADHDCQAGSDGCLATPGYRCVEHVDSTLAQALGQRARHARRNGTHVDQQRSRGESVDQAIEPQRHTLDIGTGREHGEDHFTTLADGSRRRTSDGTGGE
jgi:hypothetical protein